MKIQSTPYTNGGREEGREKERERERERERDQPCTHTGTPRYWQPLGRGRLEWKAEMRGLIFTSLHIYIEFLMRI
jgi:hypothetical protein